MSIQPLLNPRSVDDETLNLYCHSITTKQNIPARAYYEPSNLTSANFSNIRSGQGSGNFEWLLEEDDISCTIYGQLRAQGTTQIDTIAFDMPTEHDPNNAFNVNIVGSARSISIVGNPNGQTYNPYQAEIFEPSPGNFQMRIFWGTIGNIADPVNDDKFFRFRLTYKK